MGEKTANYGLALAGCEDRVARGMVNGNFVMMDEVMAGKAEGTVVAALQEAVAGKAGLVTGWYTGDGAENRSISLGFRPQAVFLCTQHGLTGYNNCTYGGLALSGAPLILTNNIEAVAEVTATGFKLTNAALRQPNVNGWKYYYIAMK